VRQEEAGSTALFMLLTGLPIAAPSFAVIGSGETLVSSVTAVTSSTTAFFAAATMPSADGVYIGQWEASTLLRRFLFRVVTTRP
jgi:hypothetical protein